MGKTISANLNLRNDDCRDVAGSMAGETESLDELCRAFADATGWPVRIVADGRRCEIENITDSMCSAPDDPGVGISPGHIRVGFDVDAISPEPPACASATNSRAPRRRCSPEAARRLADAIGLLVSQPADAQRQIRQRDVATAAAMPIVMATEEPEQLAHLLETVLQAGVDACECQAAALYMLDDATTALQLRASVGLPVERQSQPPRPLKGAVADLEALLGHAVALERASAFGPWRVPEEFAAALCLPVSSASAPLGTLWFFSDRPRDFTDRQTNLAEVIAGRIAAELEREMLLAQFCHQAPAITD